MNEIKLEDICIYHNISRKEREKDIKNRVGLMFTEGYANMGCFRCDGKDTECQGYISKVKLYNKGYNRRKDD